MLFFLPKRKSYYHRHNIPLSVRQHFAGRVQFWRSLRTNDKDTASVRSASWNARLLRLFTMLKKDGPRMTREQVDALIARYMDSELDEAEDLRATIGPVTDSYRDGVQEVLSHQFDEVSEALISCDFRKIEREAVDLLKTAGLPQLDVNGAEFGRLCRRLLSAKQEVLRIEADRWNGEYEHHKPVRNGTAPVVTPTASQVASPPSKPFTEVLRLYFHENTRALRTDGQIKAEFERFMAVLGGDKLIGAISKSDCREYKEHMLQVRALTLTTCIKHLSSLSGVFKWAEAQGFIPDGANPTRGLAPNKRQAKKQSAPRRPFTDAELLTVLGSKEFISQREENPARFWSVLICLFQVCRREEAGQLALADIGEADGIPFLNITDAGEDQGLKNAGSRRRLPIHSSLIKLGFMDYVERTKDAGHSRLFHQLKRGANGYSDAVGKFFSRLVTKAGLTDAALVLHSLRHGGITKLHAAGVAHSTVEILAGHSAQTVHSQTYVHKELLPLALLRDGLEKLRYDAVVKGLKGFNSGCRDDTGCQAPCAPGGEQACLLCRHRQSSAPPVTEGCWREM